MSFYTEKKQKTITTKDSLPDIMPKSIDESPPMFHQSSTGKRAALCILKKASFTVESALILPFFLMTVLSLFSLLDFYRIYIRESIALCEKAKKTAVYAYNTIDSHSLQNLTPDGYLTLSKVVSYQIPFSSFPLPDIQIPCYSRVHLWCGYQGTENPPSALSSEGKMVYVTDYESVYHTSLSCSHLSFHITRKPLATAKNSSNQNGVRYGACEKCIGPGISNTEVYLSDYGTAYHNTLNCSGLKRNIHLLPQSEVPELNICNRCKKKETRA